MESEKADWLKPYKPDAEGVREIMNRIKQGKQVCVYDAMKLLQGANPNPPSEQTAREMYLYIYRETWKQINEAEEKWKKEKDFKDGYCVKCGAVMHHVHIHRKYCDDCSAKRNKVYDRKFRITHRKKKHGEGKER